MTRLAQMWAENDFIRDQEGFDAAMERMQSKNRNHKIYYIIGKSASGKDSIYKELLSQLWLKPILMSTTRPMRKGEVMDREYHFTNLAEFLKMNSDNQVAEYRTYHIYDNGEYCGEWLYFTPCSELDTSESSRLGIGTLESYTYLLDNYADKLIPIYIDVNDNDRFLRAVEREKRNDKPNYKELCRRYLADLSDFSDIHLATSNITNKFTNDNFDDCISDIKQFIFDCEHNSRLNIK